MISKLELIQEIKLEVKRFQKRLDEAEKALKSDDYKVKEYASAKRGAMDLKNELTKLTQDGKYRYKDI
jgi:uncharacterized membrane protein (DUF106 family)